jgi:tetratricopeptide (TPR) repeat protein
MATDKISRKKLLQEPDEFLSLSQRIWLWVHENQQKSGAIAGGIAALILLGVGVKAYTEHSHGRRATELAAAVARYTQSPGGAIPADLQHEFSALADRHAGSPEGAVARFFQGGAHAAAGEAEKARQVYTALAAPGAATADLALLARQALAYLDLASGNTDAALAAFQQLLTQREGAVARAQIMLEIAGIHEKKGRAAEARRVYQEILADHADGSWAATAKERLRVLAELGPPAA